MTPKFFLQVGGAILVLIAVLGFVGVIGPTPEKSIFGDSWWFDSPENWTYLVLGIVALLASLVLPGSAQRGLVRLVGIIGVLAGLYSLLISTGFLGANLENPADSILHLVIGLWALMASRKRHSSSGDTMPPSLPA